MDAPSDAEVLFAAALAHKLDTALLSTRIERMTALLREHGIPLPNEDPRLGVTDGAHLAACRLVVVSAYNLMDAMAAFEKSLAELRNLVGSGAELLQPDWRG